jgi:glycine betaine/proline transport system substrate-binding protein
MQRLKLGAAVLAALALGVAGCASGNSETAGSSGGGGAGGGKQITIGYINWDEDVAVTHLWQRVLEDKGYDVKIQQISDAGPAYVGLAKGDVDLFLDGWLPATHATYWKQYGSQLTDISTWYDSAPLTIAVPNYVTDVKSLADLNAHASEFDNTLVGIEPGAGLTATTKKMMPEYGLSDWTLKTSSTAGMLASLKKAVEDKKPVVVTLWRPHWAYSAFPIHDLADPKGAMGKPDQIHAIGTGGFADDFPQVTPMVKKFHMDNDQLGSLEKDVLVDHKDDPDAGVDQWLKDNPKFESSLG